MIAWHYTDGQQYELAMLSGMLEPAERRGEIPLVWFSINPVWEPTACRAIDTPDGPQRLTVDQMRLLQGGVFRFGIHEARLSAGETQIRRLGKIGPAAGDQLIKTGLAMGSKPNEWRACRGPVPLAILKVQRLNDMHRWAPVAI